MKKYVGYFRVSTDKQGIHGLGMQAQRDAVARFIGSHDELIAEFTEVESGRKTNRPQLLAALAECKKQKATLVIAKLDRLARSVAMISSLMESKVDFVIADMPHANRLTIHILAAVAEHEREMISQRTKAGMAVAMARGVKMGNPRAKEMIAQARAARNLAPVPDDTIAIMRGWRKDGLTLQAIAAKLNGMHIRTPQGSQWYASTVSNQIKQ